MPITDEEAAMNDDYPVQYSVDYGDGRRNRLTSFFRLIMIIPIGIVGALLVATNSYFFFPIEDAGFTTVAIPTLMLGVLLMILFRKKYPRWVFNFVLEANRFGARVGAYLALLVDEYPSTDENQSVHLDIPYPNAETDLQRWMPVIKWLLAIPHYIVLMVLGIIAFVVVILAWFAILFTGRYPTWMFNYVVGVARWTYRVFAYAFMLATDRYPPFRLSP